MGKDIRLMMLTETLAYKPINILDLLMRNGYDGNVVLMCDAGQGLVPFRWDQEDSLKLAIFALHYHEKLMPAASRTRVRRFREEAERLVLCRPLPDVPVLALRHLSRARTLSEREYESTVYRLFNIAATRDQHMTEAFDLLAQRAYDQADSERGLSFAAQDYALGLVEAHMKEDVCRN